MKMGVMTRLTVTTYERKNELLMTYLYVSNVKTATLAETMLYYLY